MNALLEPKVTVAMLGARMHYAVPRLLSEADLLECFYTDSYIGNKPLLRQMLKAIPPALRPSDVERWLGREDAKLPARRVVSFETLGWWYAIARRRAKTPADRRKVSADCTARFSKLILEHPGFATRSMVWAFNGAALPLFRHARQHGRICLLEQASYPERLTNRLLASEPIRWPGWEPQRVWSNPAEPLPEELEWALADCIVCASEFVRSGLIEMGVPDDKIRVVPYGVNAEYFTAVRDARDTARPLRVLFAGRVGLWKGVPDLLQALTRLPAGSYEARIAGGNDLQSIKLSGLPDCIRFLGAIPRSSMADQYRWADVLVCPSLSEGSATVTYEALMSGVPVIATPNAGSAVRDGVDGFIVPIRDPQSLFQRLRRYADEPDLLHAHSSAAVRDRLRLDLSTYRDNLAEVVRQLAQQGSAGCD